MTTSRAHSRPTGATNRCAPCEDESAAGRAAGWLRGQGVERPVGAFVFGSGWSALVERVEILNRWAYPEVPGLPPTSVKGHPGDLVWGRWCEIPCLLFVGRWHLYEGRSLAEVVLPGLIAAAIGSRWLCCTNAAGGVAPHLAVGQLVALTDDLGVWSGWRLERDEWESMRRRASGLPANGRPQPSAYSPSLLAALFDAAGAANVSLEKGVLAMMPGPNYETAAEIRMLRMAGASVVSMSTVLEARCARLLGLEVASLSCVTNLALARPGSPLAHDDVLSILDETLDDAGRLLTAWMQHPNVRDSPR